MSGLIKKFGLLASLGLVMLASAWMAADKCCIPGYTAGTLNQKMIIVALELTPTYEGWERYLENTVCVKCKKEITKSKEQTIKCLMTQITRDLFFIAAYTLMFIIMSWIIFSHGWKRKTAFVITVGVALFDLLENLFLYRLLKGFEHNRPAAIVSSDISWMFQTSLTKWTLLMMLVLWMFHAVIHWKGWWWTAGKMGLFGAIILFVIMPAWNLQQSIQVPSVVILAYLGILVSVLIRILIKGSK